jgi:chromosome segregation ATPase
MGVNYRLADDLKHLAEEADGLYERLSELESLVQQQHEEYEKLEEEFESFKDYVDSMDDRILTAWKAQEKLT